MTRRGEHPTSIPIFSWVYRRRKTITTIAKLAIPTTINTHIAIVIQSILCALLICFEMPKKRCERLTTSPRGAVLLSPANFLLCWVTCITPPPRLIEQLRVDSPRNGVYDAHPTQNEKRNNGKEKAANCKDNYETPLVEGRKSRTTSPFQGENACSEDRSDHEAICSGAAAARYEIRIETGASEIVGPPDRAVIEL